jgi:excisionase family DNA binding protein
MPNALSVRQVAEILQVNERTVYRLATCGELPGFRVGAAWRFLDEDLTQWIDEQKRSSCRNAEFISADPTVRP